MSKRINVRPRLKELMKADGWTQTRLSEASGVPQGSISRFDSNGRHEDWQVVAIMRAGGWKYEDLFEIEDEVSDEK